MLRTLLIGIAFAGALASGIPTTVHAQPPGPREIVRKVDHGVRRAVTASDRTLQRVVRGPRHRARYATGSAAAHRRIRTMCADGRVHAGRSRAAACASHGGVRG